MSRGNPADNKPPSYEQSLLTIFKTAHPEVFANITAAYEAFVKKQQSWPINETLPFIGRPIEENLPSSVWDLDRRKIYLIKTVDGKCSTAYGINIILWMLADSLSFPKGDNTEINKKHKDLLESYIRAQISINTLIFGTLGSRLQKAIIAIVLAEPGPPDMEREWERTLSTINSVLESLNLIIMTPSSIHDSPSFRVDSTPSSSSSSSSSHISSSSAATPVRPRSAATASSSPPTHIPTSSTMPSSSRSIPSLSSASSSLFGTPSRSSASSSSSAPTLPLRSPAPSSAAASSRSIPPTTSSSSLTTPNHASSQRHTANRAGKSRRDRALGWAISTKTEAVGSQMEAKVSKPIQPLPDDLKIKIKNAF